MERPTDGWTRSASFASTSGQTTASSSSRRERSAVSASAAHCALSMGGTSVRFQRLLAPIHRSSPSPQVPEDR